MEHIDAGLCIYTGFLIYAELFRLAVIAAGLITIRLGYKLFVRGVTGSKGGSNVGAEAGPIKLTLANAGPGLGFALFGAFIIAVMLFQGNPELLVEDIKKLSASQSKKGDIVSSTKTKINIRGEDNEIATDQEWNKLTKNVTLSEAAEPLSNIARIWQQEKRIGEAVAMARLAAFYGAEKDKANYLALLGETLFENGDEQKAVSAMQKAADRDPLYRSALAHMQQRLGQRKD